MSPNFLNTVHRIFFYYLLQFLSYFRKRKPVLIFCSFVVDDALIYYFCNVFHHSTAVSTAFLSSEIRISSDLNSTVRTIFGQGQIRQLTAHAPLQFLDGQNCFNVHRKSASASMDNETGFAPFHDLHKNRGASGSTDFGSVLVVVPSQTAEFAQGANNDVTTFPPNNL